MKKTLLRGHEAGASRGTSPRITWVSWSACPHFSGSRCSWLAAAGLPIVFFFFQAEYGIRDFHVTGVQTCALPILLYGDDEARLEVEAPGAAFAFDGDGRLFRLVSEALRIRLAYLFDPLLAVHTSTLDALPHQIQAVYGEMLPRQPLRFLLADDPGAGKPIMAGRV